MGNENKKLKRTMQSGRYRMDITPTNVPVQHIMNMKTLFDSIKIEHNLFTKCTKLEQFVAWYVSI